MFARLRKFLSPEAAQVSVLMVCTANICRSPMAEGIFMAQARAAGLGKLVNIDSAGLHVGAGAGQRPDPRAVALCASAGINISRQRSRAVHESDFDDFDYIIAMDGAHMAELAVLCPDLAKDKLCSMMIYHPGNDLSEVPDPYFGPEAGFARVFELLDGAVGGLLQDIQSRLTNN